MSSKLSARFGTKGGRTPAPNPVDLWPRREQGVKHEAPHPLAGLDTLFPHGLKGAKVPEKLQIPTKFATVRDLVSLATGTDAIRVSAKGHERF